MKIEMPRSGATEPFLTPERLTLQALARDFALGEVLPVANELDSKTAQIPMALRDKMAGLGFFGILIPKEYGGLGLGLSEYAIVVEELARAWMSVASLIARGQQFTSGLDAAQREKYLPRIATGDYLGAFALSEANAGSDVASIECRAEPDGNGWRINGKKKWCTFADGADYLQVFARTEPTDPEHRARGISAFMLAKPRGTFPAGVKAIPVPKIGYHGWTTWELAFDDVYADIVIGELGQGFRTAMGNLDVARVHTAARAIGLARAALEDSIDYVSERVQFGRPIGENQALRFKIASMASQIEAARALTYEACTAVDAGRHHGIQASMVKLVATEMAVRVTNDAMQIHAGAGYTTDLPIERHWRDARLTTIIEGTSEIQMKIISDALLGRMR